MNKYDFTLDLETDNSNSIILRWIKPQSTVLEFGPAHGRMTKFLKENLQCSVTIIELDEESGSEAAKYADRALLGKIEGNIESDQWVQKLQGHTFDYIIFADVLEHLHNPGETLVRAGGLLGSNGSILISVPNIAHNSIIIELWKNRFEYRSTGLLDETHLRFFSQTSLTKLVQQTGLYVHNAHNARNLVEKTEFKHSLAEMPRQVAKAMAKRDLADVYQFIWELKKAPTFQPPENFQSKSFQTTAGDRPPKVSVLLPNYNYGCYLKAAIESVLSQDFTDFEFIVSDDASSDNSAEIIKIYAARDARIKPCIHSKNLGMVANWNWCLQQARGEYIKYIFGDDCLASGQALGRMVAMLEEHPSATLAASARLILDGNSKATGLWDELREAGKYNGPQIIARCLRNNLNVIGEPSAVMFRRVAANRGFDPALRQIVDLELWFHLLLQGDLVYTPEPLCVFRRHGDQQTAINRQSRVGDLEMIQLLTQYLGNPDFRTRIGLGPLSYRRVLFRSLYYLRKSSTSHPQFDKMSGLLQAQLPRPWWILCWFLHRVSRPFENLIRNFRLRRLGKTAEAATEQQAFLRALRSTQADPAP
jgi:glycosyltransferase involved in cell wall biosynthesis/2-polyprenyl-3-methyl-5-hydroxy-6-metoxy-1,4-benzoquinol methylase